MDDMHISLGRRCFLNSTIRALSICIFRIWLVYIRFFIIQFSRFARTFIFLKWRLNGDYRGEQQLNSRRKLDLEVTKNDLNCFLLILILVSNIIEVILHCYVQLDETLSQKTLAFLLSVLAHCIAKGNTHKKSRSTLPHEILLFYNSI